MESQKCSSCNNRTRDPSGRCYLHSGGLPSIAAPNLVPSTPPTAEHSVPLEWREAHYRSQHPDHHSATGFDVYSITDEADGMLCKTVYLLLDPWVTAKDVSDEDAADAVDEEFEGRGVAYTSDPAEKVRYEVISMEELDEVYPVARRDLYEHMPELEGTEYKALYAWEWIHKD